MKTLFAPFLRTLLLLSILGNALSVLGQSTIIEQARIGSPQTNNVDFVFSGFTATTTSDHSSAPGLVTGYSTSSRIAATGNPGNPGTNVVIFPNGGHATISNTTSPGTLSVGTTYQVAVSFSGSPTAASTDIVVTNSDTGTTGLDTFAGATSTCFQAGNGYNRWIPIGNITIASANPSIQFAYFSGVNGRWNVDSVMFTPVPTPPTAQYWDVGGSLGGTGTWDTTTPNWNPNGDGSGAAQVYIQNDVADFRGTSGTVTIAPGGITTDGGLEFDVNNYTITGGPLTLDGATGPGTNITVLSGNTATINSVISGTNGLCNAGPGTLNLGTVNNFTGTVTLFLGKLHLNPGTSQSFSSLTGSGALALGANTLTVGGDNTSTTYSGVLSDGGSATPGALIKTGSGTLTLGGVNTYFGTTTVNGGALTISSDANLGTAPSSPVANQITLSNAARLDFSASITVNSNRGITLGSGGGLLSTGGTGTTPTIPATISGSGNLFIPSGGFDLTGTNTFTGNLYLVGTNVDVTGNGLSSVRFDSTAASGAGKIFVSPGSVHNTTLRTFSYTNSIVTNAIEFDPFPGAGLYVSGALNSGKLCTLTLSGNFNGTGGVIAGLTTSGGSSFPGGTVAISGSNSAWSGGLTLQYGNLAVGSSNALGTGTFNIQAIDNGASLVLMANTPLTVASALTNAMTINLAGGTFFTIGGTNSIEISGPVTLITNNATITVTNTGDSILSGGITNATPGLTLTTAGSGTLTLSGASTYDGGTTVSAGTLKVNNTTGSGTGTGAVTVDPGAALGGSGTISGTVAVSGIISPGNSPGALTTADEGWNSGGSYTWEINAAGGTAGANPGWDLLNITGGLTVSSPFTVNITSLTLANAPGAVSDFNNTRSYTWSIAHTTSGVSGFSPGAITLNTAGFANSLGNGAFVISTNATDVLLSFAVPPAIITVNVSLAGNSAAISGTNGPPNVTYRVLTSTDVTAPLNTWTQVGTGVFANNGNFTFNGTVNPADAQRFYTIVLP